MLRLAIVVALLLASASRLGFRAALALEPVLELSTYAAGQSAVHRLSFRVNAGDPEIYRAIVTYPIAFRFAGFRAVGPPGSVVGSYELDTDFDGAADRTVPIRSTSGNAAYADIFPDGTFDRSIEPTLDVAGTDLHLRLPRGGDGDAGTVVAAASAQVTLVLAQSVLINPQLGGDYSVGAHFATVDPDTDGADDGLGAGPQTSSAEAVVRIVGPVMVPFAKLRIEHFDLKLHGRHRDRFTLRGIYVPGAASDGINLETESVGISFASFSQTIPAGAFRGWRHEREYKGRGPGVRRLELRPGGRFELEASDLRLIAPGRTARFTLRLGNDRGEATIVLPQPKGKH